MAISESDRERAYREMKEAMRNTEAFVRRVTDGNWIASDPSAAKPTEPNDKKLKELRKPIEDLILTTPHDASWDDFIGNEEAKTEMMEIIEASSKDKALYEHYGMKLGTGILLLGPPGCGKTMLAKLVAAAQTRLHGKAAEIVLMAGIESPFIGVTEAKIDAIFKYAAEYKRSNGFPLVIFVDEADSMFPARGTAGNWKTSTVNAFLGAMDGLEENGAFVILATNRPEALDGALLRDGRVSRKIRVVRPGLNEAKQMVVKNLWDAPLHVEGLLVETVTEMVIDYFVDPERIITTFTAINRFTEEMREVTLTLAHIMNGAMLTSLVERAKRFAFRRDKVDGTITGITMLDLTAAVDQFVTENALIRHPEAVAELLEALQLREADEKSALRRKMN